jgi:hypothetical protein
VSVTVPMRRWGCPWSGSCLLRHGGDDVEADVGEEEHDERYEDVAAPNDAK